MPMLEDREAEIAALALRYGAPQRVTVALPDGCFDPLGRNDRIGEVCMVIRRPDGRLLTATKTYYPSGAYRLLTGGVAPGEPIETALLREVAEETGLEVAVRRFLAVIDYQAECVGQGPRPFGTFAFLLDEIGGELAAQDASERIAEFHAVWPAELPRLAATLEGVADEYCDEINGNWRSWGIFRAAVHHVVYAALNDQIDA